MLKVIFIDDSKLVLKSIASVLAEAIENKKIECQFFENPLELYALLKKETVEYDLMFIDINMPGMDGYELIKRIRNLTKYRKKFTIAMTTEVSLEAKIKGKAAGMNGWISKMATPETMKSAIMKFIDKAISMMYK